MPLKARRRVLSSAFIAGLLFFYGCAADRLTLASENQKAEDDVPRLLKASIGDQNPTAAGDGVAVGASSLRQKGWFVEELKENASYNAYKRQYAEKKYVIELPPERLKKPEAAWDFLTSAMVDRWENWSTLFWEIFLGSKQEFDRAARGHYWRVIAPSADRIYDIVIIRNANPGASLIVDPMSGATVDRFWRAINPAKPDEFPRDSIFGPIRFLEPIAAKRFSLGQYTVMEVYAKRYFAGGSFLHSEYGKSRGRDTYILALLSQKEFVVVQTVLTENERQETILNDLVNIFAKN